MPFVVSGRCDMDAGYREERGQQVATLSFAHVPTRFASHHSVARVLTKTVTYVRLVVLTFGPLVGILLDFMPCENRKPSLFLLNVYFEKQSFLH